MLLPRRSNGDRHIYLVVATSGRAIAEALKAGGHLVAVVDGFADMDTCAASSVNRKVSRTSLGLREKEVAEAVRQLQDEYSLEGLLYDSALEFAPGLLDDIGAPRIIGNSSTVLRRCKDPKTFFSALEKNSISFPQVCFSQVRGTPVCGCRKIQRA